MDLNKLTIFEMANKRMAYLSERQRVLSQNVANANTPGYTPKDLKPMDFSNLMRDQMARLQPVVTNPAHLTGSASMSSSFADQRLTRNQIYETSPDGNAVSLEQEMMKVSDTQSQYQLNANLYQKHLAMLRTAIGRN